VQALERGHHVVTPNKGLLRAHGDELVRLALQHGVRLAFHDSIAAGWPLIHALERPMARAAVSEIQAVLSSTCNVMLELMEAGSGWQEALREVVRRQLTEPDPTLDTAGWDTAQKLGILLARMTGQRHSPRDIPTTGIEAVDPELVQAAPRVGMRVKLVAQASMVEGEVRASVSPLAVPAESHLGMVRGSNHLVLLHDLEGGEMVHLGSGGADLPVATAVLNDLIGLFDPGHSWTGRYPLAPGPVPPPAPCTRFLSLREGHPLIQAQPEPDSVGILNVLRRPT
jgi:homoserine dehydrogenase